RNSDSLACVLAVCVVQRDFDHVEVRVTREGASSLESVELWDLRVVVSRAGNGGGAHGAVGKLHLAAAGDLDSGLGDHLAGKADSHQRDVRVVVLSLRVCA